MIRSSLLATCVGASVLAAPARAQETVTLDALADFRLRYETADVETLAAQADALTARLRFGGEAKAGAFALVVESEATLALVEDYSAFPFPSPSDQRRPAYPVVPDPENLELNRLQLSWTGERAALTVGRQRINLDDQRWVGSVGWRQNEQTFDAVRATGTLGPVAVDATYAAAQRTVFGSDAGPRQSYQGDFAFLGAGADAGPVRIKAFSYLIDYDEPLVDPLSSQTYGILVSSAAPLGDAKLSMKASYARQMDWRTAARDYAADYLALEAGAEWRGFAVTGGWEKLGSDRGSALQTPLATLHKFNGFADVFLTTPEAGLEDAYVTLAHRLGDVGGVKGVNAAITYHRFDSSLGDVDYGQEWDAVLGFRLGAVSLLAKYAQYDARAFGANVRKFWLQAETSF